MLFFIIIIIVTIIITAIINIVFKYSENHFKITIINISSFLLSFFTIKNYYLRLTVIPLFLKCNNVSGDDKIELFILKNQIDAHNESQNKSYPMVDVTLKVCIFYFPPSAFPPIFHFPPSPFPPLSINLKKSDTCLGGCDRPQKFGQIANFHFCKFLFT